MNRLKNYLSAEFSALMKEIPIAVYVLWWVLRVIMIGGIFYKIQSGDNAYGVFVVAASFSGTFAIPLIRLIFKRNSFFGKFPFVIQSYANIMIFFGSFLGQVVDLYNSYPNYDKILHVVSGAVVVFLANAIIPLLNNGKGCSPLTATVTCAGFSAFVMLFWEVFEFFSDYYILNSINQRYSWTPEDELFFFRIFGRGAQKAAQYPVLDTNIDLLCGVFGCFTASVILYCILYAKKKKTMSADI